MWALQRLLVVKKLLANIEGVRDRHGLGRSPGGWHSNPLHYSCLENPMDREAWRDTVHRVSKSGTRLKWLRMHTCIYGLPEWH